MLDERLDTTDEILISVEATEKKSEQTVVDFENYGIVCNHFNDGSRRRGILSEKQYQEIINDQTTVFVNSGGSRIPVLMDVNHGLAMGYDSVKCREYAKESSSNIKILTLPPHELSDDEKEQLIKAIKSSDNFALYFSDHNNDESDALSGMLNGAGINYNEKPLVDERAAKDDRQAALYLYSCLEEQKEGNVEREKLRLRDVQEYYDNYMGPQYSSEGKVMTTLCMGDSLNDYQSEEMWKLYNEKFDFLGEGHPISMQDSRDDFLELLRSSETMIATTYNKEGDENKLICFAYYIDNMDNLYWINQNFINGLDRKQTSDGNNIGFSTDIFTPGIVSSGVGRNYSFLPIGIFVEASDRAGLSANMMFENTNYSKKYLPKILNATMAKLCNNLVFKPSEIVDQVTYRLWIIENEG